MIKGTSKIVANDISVELSDGDLFYIPKGLPYQSYWNSDDDIQFLSFGFHHFPETESKQFVLQKIDCSDEIKERVKNIPINNTIDSFVIGEFYSALAEIVGYLESMSKDTKSKIMDRAKRYIYDNTNCKVSDIAKHCLISKSELYYIFKSESDLTPNRLMQKALCEKAELLLTTTDKSIQEICDILGFSSTSYFRKIIKAHTGETPREIRNKARNI